jgi:hypothetical protein
VSRKKVPAELTATDHETMRVRHEVTPMKPEDEGYSRGRLPNGVFGFTDSPAEKDGGFFSKGGYSVFEVHKLHDGSVSILGYVTPQEAELLNAGVQNVEFSLYPSPNENSGQLIAIPSGRIVKAKPVSYIDVTHLPLIVGPAE